MTDTTRHAVLPTDLGPLTCVVDNGGLAGLYFPGRYQYAALPFVYDAGGAIAKRSGDKWTASLSSPQSQTGLTNWADFVKAVSKAPTDADETNISDVLGQGHAGMIAQPLTRARPRRRRRQPGLRSGCAGAARPCSRAPG